MKKHRQSFLIEKTGLKIARTQIRNYKLQISLTQVTENSVFWGVKLLNRDFALVIYVKRNT